MMTWCYRSTVAAILFVVVAFSAFGGTSDCARIDIRDAQGPEVRNFLSFPKDQSGFGNCFAHAAAVLLTVKLGVPVSAVDLTIASLYESKSTLPKDTEKGGILDGGPGGDPSELIESLKGKSVCREYDMPSVDDFLKGQDERTAQALKQLHDTLIGMKSANGSNIRDEHPIRLAINRYFPHVDSDTLYKILRDTDQGALVETLHRLADSDCADKRIPLPSNLNAHLLQRKKDLPRMIPAIEAQLMKNAPVAFSFTDPAPFNELADHELTILGRDMKNGKCSYIVRNSWGYGCDGLPESLRIDCNPVDGTFYLPRDLLRKKIEDLGYIE